MATEVGQLVLKVDTTGVKNAEAAVERLGDAAQDTTAKTEKMTQQSRKSNVVMGDFGRKAGMAGVQVEQLANQIAMGQNPMRALGVQAADLCFILGVSLLGAVVGIGAAIGSVLIPQLLSGADSTEELIEKFEDLGLVFGEMTAAQQAVFLMDMNDQLKELDESSAEAAEKIEQLNFKMGLLQATSQLGTGLFGESDNSEEIAEMEEEITRLNATIDTNNQLRERLTETLEKETEAEEAAREAKEKAERVAERAAIRREREIAMAEARVERIIAANDTEMESLQRKEAEKLEFINSAYEKGLISEQQYQDALTAILEKAEEDRNAIAIRTQEEETRRAEERIARLHEQNEREMQAIIEADEKKKESARQTTEQLLAFEDVLLKGKSEKEKAAFRLAVNLANAEKRENARNIISNSYDAAMKAYKSLAGIPIIGPALGAAAAATVLAAGVSYAAQSLQGRALGGQVRAGESYVVGERGPEILTMGTGGRITPNEAIRGGSQTVNKTANVSFNISANDAEGFDDLLNRRRGLIMSIVNEALNDSGRVALV
mgnify:CR=1 FL=1